MNRSTQKALVWMRVAREIATMATCARRKVGCVLLNASGHVLSTGYNGPAAGQPNCTDTPCAGAGYPSGQGLDKCEAIHAEANALIQCKDHQAIDVAVVTHFPCIHCVKLLLNTSCRSIHYASEYSHPEAFELWQRSGREATRVGVARG